MPDELVEKKKQAQYELWESRNQKVYRSNEMVQRSRYHLTHQENCILQFMLSKIKPGDRYDTMYEAPIDELVYLLRYKTTSLTKLREKIQSMADKSFWLISKDPNQDDILGRWINVAHINRGERMIRFSFHPDIAPYLFNLVEKSKGRYSGYKLAYIFSLTTYYGQRLYDILISYSNNHSYFFELGTKSKHDLFYILCSDPTHKGEVPQTWYKDFGNFKNKILDPSVKEINEYTDLKVEYELSKFDLQGVKHRKYSTITFYFRRRSEKEIEKIDRKIDDDYRELDEEYQKKVEKNKQMSIYDMENNEILERVMQEEEDEDIVTVEVEPVVSERFVETETVNVVDEDGGDSTNYYVSDVIATHTSSVEGIRKRLPDITDTEIAQLILEAERHIGENVDRTYKDSWTMRYVTFYMDNLMLSSKVKTKTTIFKRILDHVSHDYKSYALIMDTKFAKRSNNGMRDIINGRIANSVFNNIMTHDDQYEEFFDLIEKQNKSKIDSTEE